MHHYTLGLSPAAGSRAVAAPTTRIPQNLEPLILDLLLHGGRLALWPETRKRLAAHLRRRPVPMGRLATRAQRLDADVAADLRLDGLIAAAEAAGIIEVHSGGSVDIVVLMERARDVLEREEEPLDEYDGGAEPDLAPDDAAQVDLPATVPARGGVAPLRWVGRRQ